MDYLEKAKAQFEYTRNIQDNDFCKFNILWISLNCYYNWKYDNKNDRDSINLLKIEEDIKNCFHNIEPGIKRRFFQFIKNRRGWEWWVRNLKNNRLITYSDESCFSEYIEIIYTIRNNQFHGGKDPYDKYDTNLLKEASISLEKFLEKLYN